MESYNTGGIILILCALTNVQLAVGGLDSGGLHDVVIDRQSRAVMSTLNVYMEEATINVGDMEREYVDINVLQSAISNSSTSIQLAVEYDSSRSVYLEEDYFDIYPGSTNHTSRLHFKSYDDYFSTEASIINVTIVQCSGKDKCNIIEPSSTTVIVHPEKNVSISFDQDLIYLHESNYCYDPNECSYGTIYIKSNRPLQNSLEIPLKIETESNATYLVDYFFDSDPPVANLSGYTYHEFRVYVKNDDLVEGHEYIFLSFDEDRLPPRVLIGDRGSTELVITDEDYGQMTLKGANQNYSETVGTIDIVVETNFLPETDLPIKVYSYSYDAGFSAEEDFVPFDGIYYILAGTNSTVIKVVIIDDDLAEDREEISINVEAMTDSSDHLYAYGTIYIEDDETKDNPLVFYFDKDSLVANESSGTLEVFIRANLKNDAFVVLDYYPAKEKGLMEYVDYTSYFNNTIRRNIFQFNKTTEKLITVDIIDDCEIEGTEQMLLNISYLTIGSADLTLGNLTITVEDNDVEGMLMCPACTCGRSNTGGDTTTEAPTTEEPEPLMFNFEIDEFDIYEGECSFYDIYVTANRPTSATVFIGVQPYELDYGSDFTISAKKLLFEGSERQNFSFRALQDAEEEDMESTLLTIAYVSEGMVGQSNAILVHVWDGNSTSEITRRSVRSVAGQSTDELRDSSEEFGSTAIITGLLAGLVASLLVVVMTTILFGVAVLMRKQKESS